MLELKLAFSSFLISFFIFSVRVMKNDELINRVKAFEFLDSPEWVASTKIGASVPITYQVYII